MIKPSNCEIGSLWLEYLPSKAQVWWHPPPFWYFVCSKLRDRHIKGHQETPNLLLFLFPSLIYILTYSSPLSLTFITMLRSTRLVNMSLKRTIGLRHNSNVAIRDIPKKWTSLSSAEQNTIAKQLEELQKGDWKQLSKEEKAACCKFLLIKK